MSQVHVREARVAPSAAKSVELVCPRCSIHCECVFPYQASAEQRMKIRHDVMTEHVRVCSAGPAEIKIVYPINYPRS